MIQQEKLSFQWFPLGDSALILEFGNEISLEIHKRIKAFSTILEKMPFPGLVEYVPAFTTLTLYYDPWIISEKGKFDPWDKVAEIVRQLMERVEVEVETNVRIVEIPVCYGGAYGPDLEWVANYNKLTPEEVISIHAAGEYLVYMIGFAPGFPYLGGMDDRIAAPRKDKPRRTVPAGSVGIAGKQTGVYSIETPGGWQLIGRTPLPLFSPHQDPPILLKAGDRIRFVPVTTEEFEETGRQ